MLVMLPLQGNAAALAYTQRHRDKAFLFTTPCTVKQLPYTAQKSPGAAFDPQKPGLPAVPELQYLFGLIPLPFSSSKHRPGYCRGLVLTPQPGATVIASRAK